MITAMKKQKNGDYTLTFTLGEGAPEKSCVCIAGSFNKWRLDGKKKYTFAAGKHELKVKDVSPGEHEYKYYVFDDDEQASWLECPSAYCHSPNCRKNEFGTGNYFIAVRG